MAGRLLAVRVQRHDHRPLTLYLFTTLLEQAQCPVELLAQLYAQRWNIELDFRYIKAQMQLGFLEAHSADIARKEWVAGLIAYNLIRWTMASAAALAQVPVRVLSFSRARDLLLGWLARSPQHRRSARSWKRLLTRIAQAQQPQAPQIAPLRTPSHTGLPQGLRQTGRSQERRAKKTRPAIPQFLVTLDVLVRRVGCGTEMRPRMSALRACALAN